MYKEYRAGTWWNVIYTDGVSVQVFAADRDGARRQAMHAGEVKDIVPI